VPRGAPDGAAPFGVTRVRPGASVERPIVLIGRWGKSRGADVAARLKL